MFDDNIVQKKKWFDGVGMRVAHQNDAKNYSPCYYFL
jgi:hypothetical protein